jgi:hypothetical protein
VTDERFVYSGTRPDGLRVVVSFLPRPNDWWSPGVHRWHADGITGGVVRWGDGWRVVGSQTHDARCVDEVLRRTKDLLRGAL